MRHPALTQPTFIRMPNYTSYAGELALKLSDYRSKGQKEASKNRPAPDAAGLDQRENELKSEAEGWLNAQQHLFDTALVEVSRSITDARHKASQLQTQVELLESDDSLASGVDSELAGFRPGLIKATEARLRAEADIRYYRAINNIHEEARYPESTWWHFGIVAVLGLLETFINTFFYENSQGLLGGFFAALTISGLNLGTALLFGYWFRYKNLAAIDKKVLGWMSLVFFLLSAVFLNALFAAFRSEYQSVADPSEPRQIGAAFRNAWVEATHIFTADMQFQDHWSFLLFGLGLLLSIAAFWKGYTADDRFPGHGAKDKFYRASLAEEQKQQDMVRQKIKELLHSRKAVVQAAISEPGTQINMLSRRIADLTHARNNLETQAAAVLRDYVLVSQGYRDANVSVRSLPPPAYFKVEPTLTTRVNADGAASVISELQAVQAELKQLSDKHRDPLNARLRSLQEDSSGILNKTLTQFLAEVHEEAQASIARMTPTINRVQPAQPA